MSNQKHIDGTEMERKEKVRIALLRMYLQGEQKRLFRWRDEHGDEHLEFRYAR